MAMQWDEEQQDRRLLRWYRRLIQLRLASDSLTGGDFHTVLADDAANVYAFFAHRARRADARRPARRNGTLARAAPDPGLGTGICRMDALLPDGRHDRG